MVARRNRANEPNAARMAVNQGPMEGNEVSTDGVDAGVFRETATSL